MPALAQNGVVYGATILGAGVTHSWLKRQLMATYNRKGIFGNVADSEHGLKKALDEGWIWGAGLDVVEGEPQVGLDHPLVKHPRCVCVLSFRGMKTYGA